MPVNDEMMKQMDEAANQAREEIELSLNNWSAHDVIAWWSKWYMKTGHKRLGRILVEFGRNITKE